MRHATSHAGWAAGGGTKPPGDPGPEPQPPEEDPPAEPPAPRPPEPIAGPGPAAAGRRA